MQQVCEIYFMKEKVTECFFLISYVISALYKGNKQTHGKSSGYSFGVGHR
jgi:hypothetical protein